MKESPLLSIIVPVYNVEEYLETCVKSIISQEFTDYEIVLVDDGSTDNSGRICDRLCQTYSNIVVLHKENGGLSDARNVGIRYSQGRYILFIDSDDYIAKGSIQKIVECLSTKKNGIDVMFLEAKKIFPDCTTKPMGDGFKNGVLEGKNKKEILQYIAQLPKFPGSACTKLVRRDNIIKNQIFFEKGLLSEDINWTIDLLLKSDTFSYCDTEYYYYRQKRRGSITNTTSIKNIESLLYIIKKWADKDIEKDYEKAVKGFLSYEYMIALYNFALLNREERKKIRILFDSYKWILRYSQSLKVKLVRISCIVIGLDGTVCLMRMLYKNQ